MKYLLLLHLLCYGMITSAQPLDSIQSELERYYLSGLKIRSEVMKTLQTFGEHSPEMKVLNKQISSSDSVALTYVLAILNQYGWLGTSVIGEQANHCLFLTIQHATNPAIRQQYFPLLAASCEEKESAPWMMATLLDRILVESGQAQRYGTQSHWVAGELIPYPIQDAEHVNKRRKKVGLPSL